jgi:hypothetical protein
MMSGWRSTLLACCAVTVLGVILGITLATHEISYYVSGKGESKVRVSDAYLGHWLISSQSFMHELVSNRTCRMDLAASLLAQQLGLTHSSPGRSRATGMPSPHVTCSTHSN